MPGIFNLIKGLSGHQWNTVGEYALGATTIAYEASQSKRPVLEASVGTLEFIGRQLIRAQPELKPLGWMMAAIGTTLDVTFAKNRWSALASWISCSRY
jgi:hypothetical protein